MSALCSVEDGEVAEVLGFPLITKAEPYTALPTDAEGRTGLAGVGGGGQNSW